MKWIVFFASVVCVVFSALQFHVTDSIVIWKATLIATEFGHWLVILPLLGFLVLARPGVHAQNRLNLGSAGIFLLAAILFMTPMMRMQWNFQPWMQDVAKAFGAPLPTPPTPFPGLWLDGLHRPQVDAKSVEFWREGDQHLNMDIYLPKAVAAATAPWVLVVHGGGWNSGDAQQLPELNSYLAAQGIAVFAIEYRLAPGAKWPAQKQDVEHAIAYIKAHAAELTVDPARWAILGRSAGGQIAEVVAYQAKDPTLKGLIALYAPSDMNFAYKWGSDDDILSSRGLVRDFLGGSPEQVPAVFNDASPIDFVQSDSPPTLLFHGPNDSLVWYRHSLRLYEALQNAGVPAVFIEIPWAMHGFDYSLSGPGGQVSTAAITYFLQRRFSP